MIKKAHKIISKAQYSKELTWVSFCNLIFCCGFHHFHRSCLKWFSYSLSNLGISKASALPPQKLQQRRTFLNLIRNSSHTTSRWSRVCLGRQNFLIQFYRKCFSHIFPLNCHKWKILRTVRHWIFFTFTPFKLKRNENVKPFVVSITSHLLTGGHADSEKCDWSEFCKFNRKKARF